MPIPISCKCITYGRVEFLEEALECFLRQEYDGEKELVIVNDYPLQKLKFDHPNVRIINCEETFSSIGEKENFAINNCRFDTIAVWDDDDLALPNHLKNIDKYFPGHSLLHWNRGILFFGKKIEDISSLGNSGIVYSKQIWEKLGGHAGNAGYDMDFVVKINNSGEKIARACPPDEEVSWLYAWANGSYHMSGMGGDTPYRENVIVRHTKYIESERLKGNIPVGEITLTPRWNFDYPELLKSFISRKNNG